MYGIRVFGWDSLPELSPDAAASDVADCRPVTVRISQDDGDWAPAHLLDADRSAEPFGPAHQWVLDRATGTARLLGPQLDRDLLAHPCLAPVATAFNRWAGRESFHAASFVSGGRSYGVVGPRTSGKSTLMAGLAHRGATVLSDDIVITDGTHTFAGPRCVDLRTHIPGVDLATVSARLGTRFRLPLPPAPARVPLGGWIFLHWGAEVSMRRCPASTVLSRLARWRGRNRLHSDPGVLFDLATRPAWDLIRPPDWGAFDQIIETVADTLGARAPAAA